MQQNEIEGADSNFSGQNLDRGANGNGILEGVLNNSERIPQPSIWCIWSEFLNNLWSRWLRLMSWIPFWLTIPYFENSSMYIILYLSTISSKYSESFLLNLIFLVKSKRNAYSAPQLWNSIWGDNQNNLCSTEGNPDWQHAFIFIWREMLNSTKSLLNATA